MSRNTKGGHDKPAWLERRTRETTVRVRCRLCDIGEDPRSTVRTSVPFLDHMLATLARYAAIDLAVEAEGDLRHHIVEDVALVVGAALRQAVGESIARYGNRTIPMDDALVQVALDLGGRSYYEGPLPSTLYDHWMRSFSLAAQATLHVRVIRGQDRHHIVEAAFKALGLALRDATTPASTIMSTKGIVAQSLVSVTIP